MVDLTAPGPTGPKMTATVTPAGSDLPYSLRSSVVAAGLDVDPARGLELADVTERRARSGSNELEEVPRPTVLGAIRRAVTEPFVILLFVAGGLAILLGEVRDGVLVLAGLVPIIAADVLTSYRSE